MCLCLLPNNVCINDQARIDLRVSCYTCVGVFMSVALKTLPLGVYFIFAVSDFEYDCDISPEI